MRRQSNDLIRHIAADDGVRQCGCARALEDPATIAKGGGCCVASDRRASDSEDATIAVDSTTFVVGRVARDCATVNGGVALVSAVDPAALS